MSTAATGRSKTQAGRRGGQEGPHKISKGLSHRMVGVPTFPLAASAKPARPLAAVISGSISHELRAQVFEMSHGRAVRFT